MLWTTATEIRYTPVRMAKNLSNFLLEIILAKFLRESAFSLFVHENEISSISKEKLFTKSNLTNNSPISYTLSTIPDLPYNILRIAFKLKPFHKTPRQISWVWGLLPIILKTCTPKLATILNHLFHISHGYVISSD